MIKLYTEEQMLEADIAAFRKDITAGLAGALTMMHKLDEGIGMDEISLREAWAIAKKVLAGKIEEGEDIDGNDRHVPVLWADTDGRS